MDMMKLMKQAQQMQAKVQQMQAELEDAEVEGQAGAGMVKVTLTGKGRAQGDQTSIRRLMKEDEKEILEDLIIAAHNDDAMAEECAR